MKWHNWMGLFLALALMLLAGLSLWPQITSSAHASARPKPTPTATPSPTPTPSPTAPPSPTPTPTPVTGTWQVVPSPAIDVSNSTFGAKLNAVAVVTSTDIWAVGFGPVPGGPAFAKQTLIEHWNGALWSIVASPNPPSTYSQAELDGVFAVTSNDVWAVGFAEDPGCIASPCEITLIEHWNSSSWSLISSPNPDPNSNNLYSVSGVASNDVWAVGGRGDGSTCCPFQSLIEHWNGTSWSVVSNPGLNTLSGVIALAANNVWAVSFNDNPTLTNIIEHWDGTAWTNVSAPNQNVNKGRITLRAITAVSATNIWAVGSQVNPLNGRNLSATEHWDGTAWTLTGLNIQDAVLEGVTASGPTDAWAVDGGGLMQQQHWDGGTWSVVSSPDPGNGSALQGVAAISSGDVWAVGCTNTNGAITPLIEQFS